MAIEILVDSNVYIDLMKRGRDPVSTLGEWVGTSELVTCGLVRLEVLRGLKNPKARHRISSFMDIMINVRTDAAFWPDASDLAWNLDRQGKVLPGTDIVIAACALQISAAVMTSDAHFSAIEGLRVIAPPEEWFS